MAERYPPPKSSSPRPPFSIKGKETFSLAPPSLNSLDTLVQDSQLKEYSLGHDQNQIPNLLPSSSHQTAVSQECVRGSGKEIDRRLACYILKELAILYGDDQFAPLDSSQEEAGNGCEDDHKFKDQEEVMKMAHGVGFLGHQDSLELANTRSLSPRPNEDKGAFIRKVLSEYDVNSDSRLRMTEKEVLKLLPVMNLSADKICESDEVVTVKIFDTQCKKESTLALRTRNGQYFFCKGWRKKFVKERQLKQGDEIVELAWDGGAGILNFSVINRARVLSPRPNRNEDAFIRKVLNNSHVHGELSLGKKEVLQILPHIHLDALKPGKGEPVKILDTHSRKEETTLLRKQRNGRLRLTTRWTKEFVEKNDLKVGDEIELAWDKSRGILNFSVITRSGRGQSSTRA